MSELDVKIVKLEPMRVASFHAFGESPELEAAKKLVDWAKPEGLLDAEGTHRIFGFNNPDPSPGSPNYGYEFWIDIGPDYQVEKDVTVKEFGGGVYGAVRVKGVENIAPAWRKIMEWQPGSKYQWAKNQYLEEHIAPRPFSVTDKELVLDLYFPLMERIKQ